MKSSQVFPCECSRRGYTSERGWLLLPALLPAGLRALLHRAKLEQTFFPLEIPFNSSLCPLLPPPPQSLTRSPKLNPALSLRGHHLPPPACFVRLSVLLLQWCGAFPSAQNNPQFPLLLPRAVGTKAGLAAPSLQGRRAQEPVPFQA